MIPTFIFIIFVIAASIVAFFVGKSVSAVEIHDAITFSFDGKKYTLSTVVEESENEKTIKAFIKAVLTVYGTKLATDTYLLGRKVGYEEAKKMAVEVVQEYKPEMEKALRDTFESGKQAGFDEAMKTIGAIDFDQLLKFNPNKPDKPS
jgi:flagellar basal body-associated protein FliL